MLVKIPLYYHYVEAENDIDYESLGIKPPVHESCDSDLKEFDTYVNPNDVVWIEPKIDGEGCFIHVKGLDQEWYCALSVEEAAKKINEAII